MEITEVFDDIGDSFKKGNGKLIVGVAFVGLFLLVYLTQSKKESSGDTVKITGAYASYPDSVTNADVIISTLQNNLDYTSQEVQDFVAEKNQILLDSMSAMNEQGLKNAEELSDKIGMFEDKMTVGFESLGTQIDGVNSGLSNQIDGVNSGLSNQIDDALNTRFGNLHDTVNDGFMNMSERFDALGNKVENINPVTQYVSTPSYSQPTQQLSQFEQAKQQQIANLKANGMYDIVTSDGLSVGQQVELLGTSYRGSTVTGIGSTGDGKTRISTADGNTYYI